MDDDQAQSTDNSVREPRYMDFVNSKSVNPLSKPLQKSQTLMRTAVTNLPTDDTQQVTGTSSLIDPEAHLIALKTSVLSVDKSRLNRAQNTSKSELVNRFNSNQAAPKFNLPPLDPAPETTEKVEPIVSPQPQQPSMNMLSQGIAKATAHNMQPLLPEKSSSKKLIGALGVSMAVIIAIGLFVNINLKRIDVFMAAGTAGFSATLPSNGPSGFGIAKVSSAAGIISTAYKSNSDARNYTITERQSLWDSSTLLDSYVSQVAGSNYQSYQADGMTIFIYGNNNATWVNNGIWYIISSNNSLSQAQLINMATSM